MLLGQAAFAFVSCDEFIRFGELLVFGMIHGLVLRSGFLFPPACRSDVAPFLRVFGGAEVEVVGVARNRDSKPVEYPRVRIRDLQDGRVVASTTGTVLGEFSFTGLSGGSYLIELVDDDDRVLAVGQVLTLMPGETVSTSVVWVEGLADHRFALAGSSGTRRFGGSAPSVVQAASGAQVTGLGGGSNAASNEQ